MVFEVGETVVYPHHGAALIEAIEIRNIKGVPTEYLVLKVQQGDLTVRVPASNAEYVGVRDVVDAAGLEKVFGVLRLPYIEEPTNWSRRYKANVEKLASGDVIKVAEVVRDLFRRVAHLPPLQQMQAVDVETYLPGDILVKADRATMAYSLEGRSPWLDYRIAEYASRLPASWKIRGLQGKHVFKKLLEPLVPNDILYRPKMGFSVPLAHWFRTALAPVYREYVLSGAADSLIARPEAARLLEAHLTGLHDHSRKLWNVLT